METNDKTDFYEIFCKETESKGKEKDRKRALLVLISRVIVVWLLWFLFVRPYLDTSLFLLIVSLFVYIQLITVIYPRFAELKTRFREGGPR